MSDPTTFASRAQKTPDHVEALARGLGVLRIFGAEDRPLTVTEVASLAGITRTAARRFILTLERLGYVSFDGTRYSLWPTVLEIGDAYIRSHPLVKTAHPHLATLVAEVHETASLTVWHNGHSYYIDRVQADRVLSVNIVLGSRVPAYATATGRILLAGQPTAVVEEYLDRILTQAFTPNTVVEIERIHHEIAQARDQGWYLADQEYSRGIRSLAAPIRGSEGAVIATANVAAHASRVTPEDMRVSVLPRLLQATADIGETLANSPT